MGSLSELKYLGKFLPEIILLKSMQTVMPFNVPGCTANPIIRRVYWSIKTIIQCDFNWIDSQRKKSIDHSESFMQPIKVSHDGPSSFDGDL